MFLPCISEQVRFFLFDLNILFSTETKSKTRLHGEGEKAEPLETPQDGRENMEIRNI